MRSILKCLPPIFLAGFFFNAQAALNLELTQAIDAAVPVAVIPFAGQEVASAEQAENMTAVIARDLSNTGQFRVRPLAAASQMPHEPAQVDRTYWRGQNIDDLIMGKIEPLGNHLFKVTVSLVDLYNKVLLDRQYTVSASQFRREAHRIADDIYQKLTGVRGVFSTQIAYVLVQRQPGRATRYCLELADVDGYNPKTLVVSHEPLMSPVWAPNGKALAYVSFEGHRETIFLQNVLNGQRQKISSLPGINSAPAFSPEGTRLALVLTKTGTPKIYILNLQDKQLTQLTTGFSIDTEPRWAADGKALIFTSDRGGAPQIYRYTVASHQIDRLTYVGDYNAKASLLPDQQGIIMMHRDSGIFGIAMQRFDNESVRILTESGKDESPSLAPNGKMVLYATQYGGRGVLSLVSIDGRVKLRFPAREGSVQEPAWSPFLT